MPTSRLAPRTEPKPIITPFKNENQRNFPGFLKFSMRSASRSFSTCLVSSLSSRVSSASAFTWAKSVGVGRWEGRGEEVLDVVVGDVLVAFFRGVFLLGIGGRIV